MQKILNKKFTLTLSRAYLQEVIYTQKGSLIKLDGHIFNPDRAIYISNEFLKNELKNNDGLYLLNNNGEIDEDIFDLVSNEIDLHSKGFIAGCINGAKLKYLQSKLPDIKIDTV
jgi:hypothetical protein